MGTLRTIFAIAVVFAHSYGYMFVGGKNAVQLFYMISGFLISYILVERKAYPSIRSFYINRYLRLYPIYFVIAFISFLAFGIVSIFGKDVDFFKVYNDAPYAANLLLIFSNATIFLQDWVMFAGVKSNQLVFSTDFRKSEVVLYPALLVPQAWTLGVELTFYLIAPFILSKQKILFLLLILSISLRIYLISIGLGNKDPWTYRFFPTELALFLLGALAHQFLLPLYINMLSVKYIKKISSLATYALIFISLVFSFIPVSELFKTNTLFTLFLLLMPLTFIFQSNREWDKWIGNLSYPIYVCHILVINVITVFAKLIHFDKLLICISSVIFSIVFAIFLNKFVGNPIESLRNKFRIKT